MKTEEFYELFTPVYDWVSKVGDPAIFDRYGSSDIYLDMVENDLITEVLDTPESDIVGFRLLTDETRSKRVERITVPDALVEYIRATYENEGD